MNSSQLWAEGQVHEMALPLLSGKPDVSFTATAFPGEEFRGKVIYIAPVVDERSRTITIRAAIPNPRGRLKPQMFGELRVPTGGGARGILIPAESVQKDGETTFVFVAVNDTTFARRNVSLGASSAPTVEAREGIAPGEKES
ncbi:MAG: efflux RND transporter periplasmic adaptor subunit [Ignavibacteria bacterium]|nr:efflux RND transporter periplasmic adaptor subunit [Ignavibacteria bacterium]